MQKISDMHYWTSWRGQVNLARKGIRVKRRRCELHPHQASESLLRSKHLETLLMVVRDKLDEIAGDEDHPTEWERQRAKQDASSFVEVFRTDLENATGKGVKVQAVSKKGKLPKKHY